MSFHSALQPPDPNKIADPQIVQRLIRLHGDPWWLDDKTKITGINHEWWAGLFNSLNPAIHDADEGFFLYDELSGIYTKSSNHELRGLLSGQLMRVARESNLPELRHLRTLKTLDTQVAFLATIANKFNAFKSETTLVPMDNGILEIFGSTIRFHKFDPRFPIRSKSGVPYDPKATCPRFQNQILGSMFNADDCQLFVQFMGLALAGINPAQRLFIIEGDPAAGKSTLLYILTHIVGQERCIHLRPHLLDSRFELHDFHGKSLLYGVDVAQHFLNSDGAYVLKALVSTESFHTEAKFHTGRQILQGPFNVLIGTNCQLTFQGGQGDGDAWRRRLAILHAKTPPGRSRIPDLAQSILAQEGPGIVNLALGGLLAALPLIEKSGDLALSEEQNQRINALVERSNSVEIFVAECLTHDPNGSITSQELSETYAAFCADHNWPPLPEKIFLRQASQIILQKFGKSQRHDIQRNGKNSRGWTGLSLSYSTTS